MAMLDLPELRAQTINGVFTPTFAQHMLYDSVGWRVSEWWPEGTIVDLGGRELEVINVPGHTPGSVALFDKERNQLFSGDYINMVGAWAIVPGFSVNDYVTTAQKLISMTDDSLKIWEAHGDVPLERQDVANLEKEAQSVLNGTAKGEPYPVGDFACLGYQQFGRIALVVPENKEETLPPLFSKFLALADIQEVVNPDEQ